MTDLASFIAVARRVLAEATEARVLPLRRQDTGDGPQILEGDNSRVAIAYCDGTASVEDYAVDVIVLAVNALPALLDVAEAALALYPYAEHSSERLVGECAFWYGKRCDCGCKEATDAFLAARGGAL